MGDTRSFDLEAQRRPNKAGGSAGFRLARLAARARLDLMYAALDALLVTGAYAIALLVRFDGNAPGHYWARFGDFLPFVVVLHIAANGAWGLYGELWDNASVQEARRVVLAGITSMVVLVVTSLVVRTLPLSVVAMGAFVTVTFMGATRFQSRLFAFQRRSRERSGRRVVIIGAGATGAAILRDIARRQDAGMVAVAVIDDDPRKQGRSLLGVPVSGPIEALPEIAGRLDISLAVLAIPSASAESVRRVAAAAERADIPVQVVPGVRELVGGQPSVRDMRDLRIEDLLGRQQVQTDLGAVNALIEGKTVLITGGGGSIGSEIARQVARLGPRCIILLDNDETHLYDAAAGVDGPTVQLLADIRNQGLMVELFDEWRPEVVFHAAAYKHVPILENHPCEAVATNVLGTLNVVVAARPWAERFVFISTDKAVRPASVMGASKRLAEMVLLAEAPPERAWCGVRFGNVLGSRGSVIPTFLRQIQAGGPVTVTDPQMTRFFMSIEEAVQLVLQAAALAEGGEIFMLEMGEAVSILDLARRMVRLAGRQVGRDIEIRIVGTRPGEKLVEELRAPEEQLWPTAHPSIVRLSPVSTSQEHTRDLLHDLAATLDSRNRGQTAALLFGVAAGPTGIPVERDPRTTVLAAPQSAAC